MHAGGTVPEVARTDPAGETLPPTDTENEGAIAKLKHRLAKTPFGRRALGSVHGVVTTEPVFAVTFDDGPDPSVTPAVLDLLDARSARATFFMRADRAASHPDLAREVAARGHEIGVHGFCHERMTELGLAGVRRETTRARRELQQIVGVKPHWFRPPYGAQNIRTFLATRLQGMDVAVWDVDVSDAMSTAGFGAAAGPAGSLTLSAAGVDIPFSPGSVLLLHDTPARDDQDDAPARKIALISCLVEGVRCAGGQMVTLTELLRRGVADRRIWRSPGY